jgi:hypothetical protein
MRHTIYDIDTGIDCVVSDTCVVRDVPQPAGRVVVQGVMTYAWKQVLGKRTGTRRSTLEDDRGAGAVAAEVDDP